jgi:hypothetical protein
MQCGLGRLDLKITTPSGVFANDPAQTDHSCHDPTDQKPDGFVGGGAGEELRDFRIESLRGLHPENQEDGTDEKQGE